MLRAKHESIDSVLLVSTGKDMDAAETALNLSDIKPSLEIIIVVERQRSEQQAAQTDVIQHAIPQTRILTIEELSQYLSRQSGRSNRRANKGPNAQGQKRTSQ